MASVACCAEILRRTALFSQVRESRLASLLPHVQQRRCAPRSIVLRAGEPLAGLYLVTSGSLTVSHENEDGARFIESMLGPGACFGELALVGRERSSST